MSEGSHKGKAIEYLSDLLGIDRESIIAFGDNYNDLSMIEFAINSFINIISSSVSYFWSIFSSV